MSTQQPKTISKTIHTTEVLGPNGEVIPESLDDIVKNIRGVLAERETVPGSKKFKTFTGPLVKGMLSSACVVTIELVNRGAANGGIDSDKYNLLTANTTSFGKFNGVINGMLRELAAERLVVEKAKPVTKDTPPLSEEETAKLLAEPTANEETHKAEITTTDDGRFTFDKKNFKLTLHFTDGTTRELTLAPEGTWRNTALNWIVNFFKSIKDGVVKASKAIGGFFSRLNPFKLKKDDRIPTGFDVNGNPLYGPETTLEKTPEKTVTPSDKKEDKVEQPVTKEKEATKSPMETEGDELPASPATT